MSSILIKNATIVNEGKIFRNDLLIKDELISAIGRSETWNIPGGTINYRGRRTAPAARYN